jgi:excisionase family DNA binding protein
MKPPRGFKTVSEAWKKLGIDRQTLFRWIWDKKIKTIRPGKSYFISEKDIDRLLGKK